MQESEHSLLPPPCFPCTLIPPTHCPGMTYEVDVQGSVPPPPSPRPFLIHSSLSLIVLIEPARSTCKGQNTPCSHLRPFPALLSLPLIVLV